MNVNNIFDQTTDIWILDFVEYLKKSYIDDSIIYSFS